MIVSTWRYNTAACVVNITNIQFSTSFLANFISYCSFIRPTTTLRSVNAKKVSGETPASTRVQEDTVHHVTEMEFVTRLQDYALVTSTGVEMNCVVSVQKAGTVQIAPYFFKITT